MLVNEPYEEPAKEQVDISLNIQIGDGVSQNINIPVEIHDDLIAALRQDDPNNPPIFIRLNKSVVLPSRKGNPNNSPIRFFKREILFVPSSAPDLNAAPPPPPDDSRLTEIERKLDEILFILKKMNLTP